MRLYHLQVFDDIISGTSSTWYSNADHDSTLGGADWIVVGAVTSSVSGTSPSLSLFVEYSGDGINWSSPFPPLLGGSISNQGLHANVLSPGGTFPVLLSHIRLKFTLSGTNPQCRLRLYVTGRARGRFAA